MKPPSLVSRRPHCIEASAKNIPQFELRVSGPNYPITLQQAHPPVPMLFGLGNKAIVERIANSPGLAIVGSRQASTQGMADAHWFAREASKVGLTIISGLAQGIDAAAHRGGLEGCGSTIAVLGHGRDTVYPGQHRDLADLISCSGGALVTEYPDQTPAIAWHFPQRNRIIAALAQAVLVVEATPQSGSLITARHALELGIDVYVLPGSIHMPQSVGCNGLIRQGAQLIQSPEQLFEDLGMVVRKKTSPAPPRQQTPGLGERPIPPDIDGPTRKVLEALSFHPTAAEALANQIGLASGAVYAGLLMLELSGLVARTHDGRWHKTGL